jgi:hypothetical protein
MMTLPPNVVDLTEFIVLIDSPTGSPSSTPTPRGMLPISATTLGAYTDRDAIIVRADLPPG